MRLIGLLVSLAHQGLAMSAGAGAAPVSVPIEAQCESHTPRSERLDITCLLSASEATQRFRFKAHFSGSHDDTTASLTPTLDGKPLACDEGSKTRLEGEEGDVALECRFSITQAAGAKQALRVQLSWHHAQYTNFEVATE